MISLILYLFIQIAITVSLLDLGVSFDWSTGLMVVISLILLGSVALLTYIIIKMIKEPNKKPAQPYPQEPVTHYESSGELGFCSLTLGLLDDSSHESDNGRCNGDCDNCPPHYGYRYGRWYYGHGHQHGCERGGNGGASGRCYRN